VLDEDGSYSTGTGTSQCTVVFGTTGVPFHRRVRKFELPYHAPEDPPRPMTVWVQSGGNWYKAGHGATRILPDHCGIEFPLNTVDNGDNKSAIHGGRTTGTTTTKIKLNDITGVKVTAMVRGDYRAEGHVDRVTAAASTFRIESSKIDDTFRRVFRHETSDYAAAGATTTVTVIDTSADLAVIALKQQAMSEGLAISCSLITPWITFSYLLGGRVTRIGSEDITAGRNISLIATRVAKGSQTQPDYPRIVAVNFDAERQQTEVNLADERERRF
jgi:hypothetical protein